MSPAWQRGLGAIALLWALASSAVTWRAAVARGSDRVTTLEAELSGLARATPRGGSVGFLEYHEQPDSSDHVQAYYVAQYAFAPRLVTRGASADYLVVVDGAARPGSDARLTGFSPLAGTPGGHRLYQRQAP